MQSASDLNYTALKYGIYFRQTLCAFYQIFFFSSSPKSSFWSHTPVYYYATATLGLGRVWGRLSFAVGGVSRYGLLWFLDIKGRLNTYIGETRKPWVGILWVVNTRASNDCFGFIADMKNVACHHDRGRKSLSIFLCIGDVGFLTSL